MASNTIPESSQKLCLKIALLFEQTLSGQEKKEEGPKLQLVDSRWEEDDVQKIEVPTLFARLAHLLFYFEAEDSQMVAALALMNKLLAQPYCRSLGRIRLTAKTTYRLFAVSLLLIVKTTSDFFYGNDVYTKVLEIPLQHLNKLEEQYLFEGIDFDVNVTQEEYVRFACLVSRVGPKAQTSEDISKPAPKEEKKAEVQKLSKTIKKPAQESKSPSKRLLEMKKQAKQA